MSGCGEGCGEIEDLDKTIGFQREKTKSPVGTTDLYYLHLFVCTGHSEWTKTFPVGERDNIKSFIKTAKDKKKSLKVNSRITATDLLRGSEDEREGFIRVIAFPIAKEFLIDENNIENDTNTLFTYFNAWFSGEELPNLVNLPLPLRHSHFVFICSHEQMDKRCGYCGPKLVTSFEEKLQSLSENHVKVAKVSHVGGHVYAGNVIVFPAGDWFGYVDPGRVEGIIKASIIDYDANGTPSLIPDIWRGRIGLTGEQQAEILSGIQQ